MKTLLLALLLLPGLAAARPLAFVLNSNDASISVIDVSTHAELQRIPVLREPHHMALTPDGRSLLVGDTSGNAVFFLDPQTGEMQRRATISDPYQLQFSPDGKWFTVAGLARNQIDIYDAATLTLQHRVPASSMPSHMNYSPDSSTVYVSLQESNALIAIDVKSGDVKWKQPVGKSPAGVLWLDGHVLVAVMGADYVAVVDPATGAVERKVTTAPGAHNLFITPDHDTLYVCNRVDGSISVVDPHTLTERKRIHLSGGPDDLDFAPDGKIWVSRRWAHSIALLDPATGDYTTIETGRSPHGIWLNTHPATPLQVSAR